MHAQSRLNGDLRNTMLLETVVIFAFFVRGIQPVKIVNREGDSTHINYAKPLRNKVLIDTVGILENFEVPDENTCAFKCLATKGCRSYNFGQNGYGKRNCEILNNTIITSKGNVEFKEGYIHVSLKNPCEQNLCANGGECIPLYEKEEEYMCNCKSTGHKGRSCKEACTVFDFETSLTGWSLSGTAFNKQPTYGDNPTARGRGQPSNHRGNWWIGGAEDRPSPDHPAGILLDGNGDAARGTLVSPEFLIGGNSLQFMIGGGCDVRVVRVELLVENSVVLEATGKCTETLEERSWDVKAYQNKKAQLRLIDASSSGWGHINFDDLREIC